MSGPRLSPSSLSLSDGTNGSLIGSPTGTAELASTSEEIFTTIVKLLKRLYRDINRIDDAHLPLILHPLLSSLLTGESNPPADTDPTVTASLQHTRHMLETFFTNTLDTSIDLRRTIDWRQLAAAIESFTPPSTPLPHTDLPFSSDLFHLLELFLLSAIHSPRKEVVIHSIMCLSDIEQSQLMQSIHSTTETYLPHLNQTTNQTTQQGEMQISTNGTPIVTTIEEEPDFALPLHARARQKGNNKSPRKPSPISLSPSFDSPIDGSPLSSSGGGVSVRLSPLPASASASVSLSSLLPVRSHHSASSSPDLEAQFINLQTENKHLRTQIAAALNEEACLAKEHAKELQQLQELIDASIPLKKHTDLMREAQAKSSAVIFEHEERIAYLDAQVASVGSAHTATALEHQKVLLKHASLQRDFDQLNESLEVAQVRLEEAKRSDIKILKLKERIETLQSVKLEKNQIEQAYATIEHETQALREKVHEYESKIKPAYDKYKARVMEMENIMRDADIRRQSDEITIADLQSQLQQQREQIQHLRTTTASNPPSRLRSPLGPNDVAAPPSGRSSPSSESDFSEPAESLAQDMATTPTHSADTKQQDQQGTEAIPDAAETTPVAHDAELAAAQLRIVELTAQLAGLESSSSAQLQTSGDRILSLTSEVDRLQSQLSTVTSEHADLDASLAELSGEVARLQADLEAANAATIAATADAAAAAAAAAMAAQPSQNEIAIAAQLAELQSHIAELESDLSLSKQQCVSLESALSSSTARVSALEADLSASHLRIDGLEQAASNLLLVETRAAQLESQLNEAATRAEQAEARIEQAQTRITHIEQQCTQANEQAKQFEQQLTHATQRNTELDQQLHASNAQVTDLGTQLTASSARVLSLEQSASVAAASAAAAAAAAVESVSPRGVKWQDLDDVEQLKSDLADSTSRITELETDLAMVQTMFGETAEREQAIEIKLQQAEEELKRVTQESTQRAESIEQLQKEIDAMRTKLTDAESSLTSALALAASEYKLSPLQPSPSSASSTGTGDIPPASSSEGDHSALADLRSEVASLQSQLSASDAALSAARAELAAAGATSESALGGMRVLQAALADAVAAAPPPATANDDEGELAHLRAQLADSDSFLAATRSLLADSESKLHSSQQFATVQTSQLSDLESQLSSLQESYADVHAQYLDRCQELDEAQQIAEEQAALVAELQQDLDQSHTDGEQREEQLRRERDEWKSQALVGRTVGATSEQASDDHEAMAADLAEARQMIESLTRDRNEWKARHREDINSMNAKLLALAQRHDRDRAGSGYSTPLRHSRSSSPAPHRSSAQKATPFGSSLSPVLSPVPPPDSPSAESAESSSASDPSSSSLSPLVPSSSLLLVPGMTGVSSVDATKFSMLKTRLTVQSRELLAVKKELATAINNIARLEHERVELESKHERELCKAFDALSALQGAPVVLTSPKHVPHARSMGEETLKASAINTYNAQKHAEQTAVQLHDCEAKLRLLYGAYRRLERKHAQTEVRWKQIIRGPVTPPITNTARQCREEILERERLRVEELECCHRQQRLLMSAFYSIGCELTNANVRTQEQEHGQDQETE